MQADSNHKLDPLIEQFLRYLIPSLTPSEIDDVLQLVTVGFPLRIALRLIQLDRSDPLFEAGDS